MIWMILILVALALLAAFAPDLLEWGRLPMDEAARREAPGRFTRLSGGVTHYRWFGRSRGPVAVCVHGLTTPSFVWEGVAEGLEEQGFRVLVYDLFGRGYSDRPADAQTADFFVTQLQDLLKDQGIDDDITLLGYSMGGAIATAFAARFPGRLRRLILLAPAGMQHDLGEVETVLRASPWVGRWLLHMFYPKQHRAGCEAERGLPTSVPGIVDLQLNEQRYRGFFDAVLSSLRNVLHGPLEAEHRTIDRADLPVLAIWGKDDTVIPIKAMGELARWNRTARHEVIEGAGHGVTYTHTPQVVAAIFEAVSDLD